MNEQDLVLTVGVQVRGLDVPLLGLDLQLVKIEILAEALETNQRLVVEVANRIADAVPVGVAEGRKIRVGEIAQPESVGVGRRRGSIRSQAEPIEVGEQSSGRGIVSGAWEDDAAMRAGVGGKGDAREPSPSRLGMERRGVVRAERPSQQRVELRRVEAIMPVPDRWIVGGLALDQIGKPVSVEIGDVNGPALLGVVGLAQKKRWIGKLAADPPEPPEVDAV
jgi:hypothetical protein